MIRRPPRFTHTDTLVPATTPSRSIRRRRNTSMTASRRIRRRPLPRNLNDEHRLARKEQQPCVPLIFSYRSSSRRRTMTEIGRAHVWTPVTNAQLACPLLHEIYNLIITTKKQTHNKNISQYA